MVLCVPSRWWWLCVLSVGLAVSTAFASTLFEKPLHLTRRVSDSLSNSETTIEEYCAGNRIVTVRGNLVAIADYERQELTEIDRATGTYSVTRFDSIARAHQTAPRNTEVEAEVKANRPQAERRGARRSAAGREVEAFEIAGDREGETIDVAIDRGVTLSRAAVDVLIGAAYPNRPAPRHEAIALSAANDRSPSANLPAESYALPAEQTFRFDAEGTSVTLSNTVIRVGHEPAPPELIAIPPGARLVESRITALPKALEELDRPASGPRP